MRRREFFGVVSALAAGWSTSARAQQAVPVIGYFSGRSSDAEAAVREPFAKGLEKAGFQLGRNAKIEYRFAGGRDELLPAIAADLVRFRVSILVATDRPAALAAKASTSTIPIVFTSGDDPVRIGLVASLNKPGGNATGIYVFNNNLGPKRLELVRELLPKPGLIAFVVDPNSSAALLQIEQMQAAARTLGQPLLVLHVGTEREAEVSFGAMARQKVSAIIYGATLFYQIIRAHLIELAARYKIPACYEWNDAVTAGGLMSYNTNRDEIGQLMGRYASQILNGAKPADLPVVQSSNFVFAINLKTAKALGLTIPDTLLARADEVIE
jgi:ABC-type uncharacterized transport system substrate-binding protein